MTDLELLNQYVRDHSEQAFADLVERYIRLVHSACWRQLADAHRAEDATQLVFELLSRKAGKLHQQPLAGWLLTAAHYTCSNLKRAEDRRQRREQGIAMQPNPTQPNVAEEAEMLQLLDAGLMRLRESDRQAVVLRFMQEQPLSAVGQALGLSEDAARKRVSRGLGKLRQYLQAHGVTTETAALSAALANPAHVPAVPGTLGPRIVQACRVRVPGPAWALGPKAAAAGIIFAGAAAVTGWGIHGSHASATQPAPLAGPARVLALAAPVAAAAAPATGPATGPAAEGDWSTPDNTLATLTRAMQQGDRDAIDGCFLEGPHQPPTPLDASVEGLVAGHRLEVAAKKAYGEAASQLRQGFPPTMVLQAVVTVRRLRGITVPIEGDNAVMHVELPNSVMMLVPDDARPVVESWAGKPVYFVRRHGKWLMDGGRSLRWVLKIQRTPNGRLIEPPATENAAITMEMAAITDEIADGIKRGEFPHPSDASYEFQLKAQQRVMAKYGICGFSTGLTPADNATR